MADEFEDEEIEIEVDETDDDLVLDDDADDLDADLADDDEVVAIEAVVDAPADAVPVAKKSGDDDSDDDDDENLDLEEELHPDDVEEPLDVLLAERTTAERMDEDEAELEDDDPDPDAGAEGGGKIVPRRDDEFLCRSCFLVKPLSQLAKGEKDLCRDCE